MTDKNLEPENTSLNSSTTLWPRGSDIAVDPPWFLSLAVTLLIVVTNMWIAFAFIHHAVTTKVLKKKRSKKDVNGGFVIVMAMAAVVMPFFRYFGTLFFLLVSLDPDNAWGCETASDISVAGFGLSVLPMYSFLWARQRAFYGHPSLGHMLGTEVSVFSSLSIVLIVLSAVASLTLGIYPVEYEPKPGGCFLIGEEEQDDYRTYVYAVVMISSQLVLLGLLLHPIRVHAQLQKQMGVNYTTKGEATELSSPEAQSTNSEDSSRETALFQQNSKSNPTNSDSSSDGKLERVPKTTRAMSAPSYPPMKHVGKNSQCHRKSAGNVNPESQKPSQNVPIVRNNPSSGLRANLAIARIKNKVKKSKTKNKKIYHLIRRVLYLAVISVCSDVVFMLLNSFVMPDDVPQTYSFVMYDVSTLINVVTVVLSFESWSAMMQSPCSRQEKKSGVR